MKKIMILLLFLIAQSADAVEVSWMYIQHRIYENGRSYNRLAFGLSDDDGRDLGDDSAVSITLSDPKGRFIKLSDYKFSMDEEIYGTYDCLRSQWHFGEEWQVDRWFSANFTEPVVSGKYRLTVRTTDSHAAGYEFTFKGGADLPFISSRSFEIHPDPFGNLIWKWDIPDVLGQMVVDLQTVVKASIDINQEDKQVAYFFIKLPTHMGYLFIPRNLVLKLGSKGNQFGFRIQLETRDNSMRTYSNTLVLNDLTNAAVSPRISSDSPK